MLVIDCVMLTSLTMECTILLALCLNGLGIERIGRVIEVRTLDTGGIEHV